MRLTPQDYWRYFFSVLKSGFLAASTNVLKKRKRPVSWLRSSFLLLNHRNITMTLKIIQFLAINRKFLRCILCTFGYISEVNVVNNGIQSNYGRIRFCLERIYSMKTQIISLECSSNCFLIWKIELFIKVKCNFPICAFDCFALFQLDECFKIQRAF